MTDTAIFRTAVQADWIDYNGHLRDAYYGLIVSLAADALMERIGLDAGYRERTRCTLYTLELHLHFLHEVMLSDVVDVHARILGFDAKRIHAAFDMSCARVSVPVATAEVMLLHVHQGDKPAARELPSGVAAALQALPANGTTGELPGSREIRLRGHR